jgi:hypothetical protein
VDICPDVFEMGEERAQVKMGNIPSEFEKAAQQAVDECPVSVIVTKKYGSTPFRSSEHIEVKMSVGQHAGGC